MPDRNLRINIVVRSGDLGDAPNREYSDKFIMLNVTHADPHVQVHLRGGSADHDGSAAYIFQVRKHQHYARPGYVPSTNGVANLPLWRWKALGASG